LVGTTPRQAALVLAVEFTCRWRPSVQHALLDMRVAATRRDHYVALVHRVMHKAARTQYAFRQQRSWNGTAMRTQHLRRFVGLVN
jgi:hypothetical protein